MKLPVRATKREAILQLFRVRGSSGMTVDELEEITLMPHQTASARVHDLKNDGLIVNTGVKRKTRMGRPATVWKISG